MLLLLFFNHDLLLKSKGWGDGESVNCESKRTWVQILPLLPCQRLSKHVKGKMENDRGRRHHRNCGPLLPIPVTITPSVLCTLSQQELFLLQVAFVNCFVPTTQKILIKAPPQKDCVDISRCRNLQFKTVSSNRFCSVGWQRESAVCVSRLRHFRKKVLRCDL